MKTITFTCETITPMFLSGADGSTPELRPPSIKGALRFWWRAMNGHLDLKTLKEQESLIFGGTDGESGGRSRVIIRIKHHRKTEEAMKTNDRAVLVEHRGTTQKAFIEKQTFQTILSLTQNVIDDKKQEVFNIEKLKVLFELVCLLGGFGKRTRRGKGSVKITKIDEQNYVQPDTKGIETMLNRINNKFILTNNIIYSDFRRVQTYATIKEIQVGNAKNDILRKISDTTHKFHKNHFQNYNSTFGHASRGRFASPVYVSTLQEGNNLKSIVTILHTEPQSDKHLVKTDLQQEFKKEIL
jgi:CRISPR-associated protein Cmr1